MLEKILARISVFIICGSLSILFYFLVRDTWKESLCVFAILMGIYLACVIMFYIVQWAIWAFENI